MTMPSPKRSFSLKIFSARGTLPVSTDTEEHIFEYTASEKQHNDIFQASLDDFQHEFSKEETAQSVGERSRAEEFDQTIAKYEGLFNMRLQRRQDLYLETDARQEEIYRSAEAVREALFKEGQKERAETFKSTQELRHKRIEWQSAARETLIQQARQKWDEACASLDASLVGQFDKLLRSQEVDFLADEQRRESIVAKLLETENKQEVSGSELDESLASYDQQFISTEQARQGVFMEQENERNERFQAMENEREAAEGERSKVYEEKWEAWEAKSQTMLEAHETHYTGRENTRADGETRRDAIAKATREREAQILAMLLSYIDKQAEAEEKFEEDRAEHQKSALEDLFRNQSDQLKAAMGDRQYRFRNAQKCRDSELGVSPPVQPPKRSSYDPIGRLGSRHRHRPHYESARYYPYPTAEPQVIVVPPSPFPMPVPVSRYSPAAGFTAGALFRGGANVHAALPVAGSDDPAYQALRRELKFVNLQRRYQRLFEKSQERREEAFEKAVQKRRRTFRASEERRVEKFEEGQRHRKQKFGQQEDLQETTFQEDQQRREKSFQDAERNRELAFHRKEDARDEAFRQAQEDQADRFHKKQMELQKKCIDAGKRRILNLEAWGMKLLRDRDTEQKKLCEAEQRECDYVFKLSLECFQAAGLHNLIQSNPYASDAAWPCYSIIIAPAAMRSPNRSLSLKMFSAFGGGLPVSPDSEHTFEYAASGSEKDRDDIFQVNLYDFQQQYSQEAKAQSVGERARSEDFDQLINRYEDILGTALQRRQDLYVEVDARQEEVYKSTEAMRETTFKDAQKERAEMFKKDQELRLQRSEWHSAAREILIQKARQKWNEGCAALDATLAAQVNALLSCQEDEFLVDEQRRDKLVEKLSQAGKKQEIFASRDANITAQFPVMTRPVSPYRSPSRSPARPYSKEMVIPDRMRSPSPGRPPTGRVYSPPPHVMFHNRSPSRMNQPPPILIQTSYSPSRSRGFSRYHSASGRPNGKDARESGSYDQEFTSAEQARQRIFSEEEHRRDDRFQAAEDEREGAEAERSRVYEDKEKMWSTKSRVMLQTHEVHYTGREAARAEGETRQDAIFKATQERRSQIFSMLLSHIEKQAEAEGALEEDLAEYQKTAIEAHYKKQSIQLQNAMDDRRYRFRKAQTRRDNDLSPQVQPSKNRHQHFPREVRASFPGSRPHKGIEAADSLFEGGTNIQTARPIARSGDPVIQMLHQELVFTNRQENHQRLFEKSQQRREKMFEKAVQERRHAFRISEAKRVEKFEKAQRHRKDTFSQQEDVQETAFQEAQQRREKSFQDAERSREVTFHRKEVERDEVFRQGQEDQADRFHRKQMELQNKVIEIGKRRIVDLAAWGKKLLQDRELEQRRLCEEEQRECDNVFKLSLAAHVSRD
ncbi:hypothetical protein DXG01_008778 [Tephrocybe rancida]|nr:hypothetical protein DXG01_008778 [Tephrocybe rancida]